MPLPIPEHPAMFKWDSTKINRYCECPRAVFYEYLLGWRTDQPSNHLVFGDAIHLGLAHLLENGFDETSVTQAQNIFSTRYREEFGPETDEMFYPKDVFNGERALAMYPLEYPRELDESEVLFTEVAGSVPIDESRRLYLRMDAILRNKEQGYYFIREHKTKGGDFNHVWDAEWELAFQAFTYTHALYCMYPMDEVKGVEVNGLAFIKAAKTGGRVAFRRVPVWKSLPQMQEWLWLANEKLDQIYHDLDRLEKCTEDDPILYAFPRNDRNCTKYFKICEFHDFCLTWGNPLRRAKEPPLGFKVERWDPEEKEAKHRMELEWKK